MRVLVIGGAGYIGSVVTEQLIKGKHHVVVFDNLVQGHLEAVPAGAEFFLGDVANQEALESVFGRWPFDAVIDLAGETIVTDSMTNPFKYFKKNVVDGLNVLEAMVKYGVKRIIFSSTSAVYGEPETIPMPENHRQEPGNSYGESKLIFEKMIKWYDYAFGIRFGILRYFNAAGASRNFGEDHRPETHLIPLVLQVALGQREFLTIFGTDYETPDGTCIRGYTQVEDLARAHILLLENLDKLGSKIYNVGTLKGYSVMEVIDCVREITGAQIPAIRGPRRAGDVRVMVADSTKIRHELGWKPAYEDIHSIVKTAWDWHRRYPNGYSK